MEPWEPFGLNFLKFFLKCDFAIDSSLEVIILAPSEHLSEHQTTSHLLLSFPLSPYKSIFVDSERQELWRSKYC